MRQQNHRNWKLPESGHDRTQALHIVGVVGPMDGRHEVRRIGVNAAR